MDGEFLFRIIEKVFYFTFSFILVYYYLPIHISLFVFVPLALKIYTRLTCGVCKSYKRLDGQTAIVTGGNVGIGLEAAKDLARRGAKVILACRSLDKGNAALAEIKRETGSSALALKELDLCSFASVRKFCKEINAEESRLDILINNAGAATVVRTLTADKLETNFQANHYGPFLLTILLLDLMQKTGKARIVNVSSMAHWFLKSFDIEDFKSENGFEHVVVYARTKLANLLFTRELSRKLVAKGISDITVNALHPGTVRSAFFRSVNELWYMKILNPVQLFLGKSVVEGAQTTIHLAVSEEVDGVSGEYFEDCHKAWSSGKSKDVNLAKELWDHSVKAVGLKADEITV